MKLIEYKPRPDAKKIAALVFAVSLTVRVVLLLLQLFAGLTLLGKVSIYFINFVVLFSAVFLIQKKRIFFYSMIAVLLLVNTFLLLLGNDRAEYQFVSPQGESTLVIQEKSALVSSGWADVYRKEYGIFKRKLDYKVGTDDNYQPFTQGQYRLEWSDEHTIQLYYYDGHGYRQLELTL